MDDDQSFRSLGFDSLGGVRLRNRLRDLTGVDLPVTAVFDHPTPKVLAAHVADEVAGEVAEVTDRAPVSRPTRRAHRDHRHWACGSRRRGEPGRPVAPGHRATRRDLRFPPTGAGTPTGSTTGSAHPGTTYTRSGGSSTTPPSSTLGCSGSPRARHWPWTRSNGCSWRRPGRPWSGRHRPAVRPGRRDRCVHRDRAPRLRDQAEPDSRGGPWISS
nr:acyl carrier protein [Streptomyces rubradiris]